jgi:hypothetical protein
MIFAFFTYKLYFVRRVTILASNQYVIFTESNQNGDDEVTVNIFVDTTSKPVGFKSVFCKISRSIDGVTPTCA